MKDQLKRLRELQQIDIELDKFRRSKDEIVETINENKGFLEKLVADLDSQRLELSEIRGLQTAKKDDSKDIRENLERRKKRLHNVGSTKEFNAVEKEIEVLKKSLDQTEQDLLHLEEVIDTTQGSIDDKNGKIEALRKTISDEEAASADTLAGIDKDMAGLKSREEEARGEVSKRVLYKYDFIRERREGLAVVAAKEGHCESCYMSIPAQQYIEIQRGDNLATCPSCQCILYFWEDAIGEPGGPQIKGVPAAVSEEE